jgi:hypothetical protein
MRNRFPLLLMTLFLAIPALACGKSNALVFSPEKLSEGQAGLPYKAVISLTNQNTPAFSMGAPVENLPPGLTGTFDQEKQTYIISGTPTQPGTYKFTVSAICYGTNVSGQSGEKDYELVVR